MMADLCLSRTYSYASHLYTVNVIATVCLIYRHERDACMCHCEQPNATKATAEWLYDSS
jgi:hypothetical protein